MFVSEGPLGVTSIPTVRPTNTAPTISASTFHHVQSTVTVPRGTIARTTGVSLGLRVPTVCVPKATCTATRKTFVSTTTMSVSQTRIVPLDGLVRLLAFALNQASNAQSTTIARAVIIASTTLATPVFLVARARAVEQGNIVMHRISVFTTIMSVLQTRIVTLAGLA
jgi:hypothetical protein